MISGGQSAHLIFELYTEGLIRVMSRSSLSGKMCPPPPYSIAKGYRRDANKVLAGFDVEMDDTHECVQSGMAG